MLPTIRELLVNAAPLAGTIISGPRLVIASLSVNIRPSASAPVLASLAVGSIQQAPLASKLSANLVSDIQVLPSNPAARRPMILLDFLQFRGGFSALWNRIGAPGSEVAS